MDYELVCRCRDHVDSVMLQESTLLGKRSFIANDACFLFCSFYKLNIKSIVIYYLYTLIYLDRYNNEAQQL